ncbi:MAG: histidine kinase N-terminal 7TM domain-containing protein [Oscillospiraceae bacterium]
MTNESILLVIGLLIAIDVITVVIALVQKGMRRVTKAFFAFSLCVIGWLASDFAYYAASNRSAIMYLFNLKFPFVAFMPVALLVLIMRFYRLDDKITRKFIVLLSILPLITSVLALTSPLHPFIRSEQALLAVDPLHLMHRVRGVWFWVHTVYSYALTILSAVVVLTQHKKLPSGYRAPSVVLVIAMVINLLANLSALTFASDNPLDFSLVGVGVALVFVYVAVATSTKTDLLEIARDEIFNYLEEYVFILDLHQQVLEANLTGRRWLTQLGLALDFPFPFARVFDVLRSKGTTIRENAQQEAGTDIYYSYGDRGVVYNMTDRFVLDRRGVPMGVYTTLVDITRYKAVIDQLEKAVEIDPLTGLANRRVFEQLKDKYNEEQTMPLAVVLGDANGLKRVNDTLGHQQGDLLLRLLAQQLRQCAPPDSTVARIGGDEFVILMPGQTEEGATKFIKSVEWDLASKTGYSFKPSIALGYAERTWVEDGLETVDSLIHRADVAMYRRKENDRRASRR